MFSVTILGIESSCDDTAAAVYKNGKCLSNIVAQQKVHEAWGGVVPELASRDHQKNIVMVVDQALKTAGINKGELSAIAFTRGPGLIGSLLVGVSFAKALSLALEIPLIEVNHMQAHILSNFLENSANKFSKPAFPFLCLTVSGGHTQIVQVNDYLDMNVIGETLDDAAGEVFDKVAKILGLPYPGGHLIDEHARRGNAKRFSFPHPQVKELNFSFSGLKTSFLYFIRKQVKEEPDFVSINLDDLCASIQQTIVDILMKKLIQATTQTGIMEIAIAGGVSANSGLRAALQEMKKNNGWNIYIPDFEFCSDNAAMIAITGYYKFMKKQFTDQKSTATARYLF